ncbi:GNAT family N-acetyltransferase [Calothrix sp. FACHB-1219]|uniref:GNAT family N-acetyltransferase n=1 Tax=unclassified Calothrix TaxID=2619626 RepID=UPI00168419A1|nr:MULTISPECIES: GNAT family N-acetyltransferase [unclassified Calothrix]MBD2207132.1 GNAT family N-acetyltransferase [Calothrix sp. FACHB-168]MBD2221789.1 GNAT family N-acetyltransferase [Calothrix sp. FACHB-1219]
MPEQLLPGYSIRLGSALNRALLVKFMQRSYQDIFPSEDFSHLAQTVEQYFSSKTPLWWVDEEERADEQGSRGEFSPLSPLSSPSPVACLWVGNAIDQLSGSRHAHIFLLYVVPEHRRRGIGTALMKYLENWATQRGDRQIGLQVFQSNQAALNLYDQLGYQTQSLWMVKSLNIEK